MKRRHPEFDEGRIIKIYTDGSCHSQLLIGAWAAILFIGEKKIMLQDIETETTHNRMELLAVIKAVEYLEANKLADPDSHQDDIEVYSDSQYVVNLLVRREKLKLKNFLTKKGTPIQNADLVQKLIKQIELYGISFVKVKAHVKDGDKINMEVDILVRKLLRTKVADQNGK